MSDDACTDTQVLRGEPKTFRWRWQDNRLGRLRWAAVAATTAGLSSSGPCVLGPRTRLQLAPGSRLSLGSRVVIRSDFTGAVEGRCEIGDDVFINRWCYVSAFSSVVIGSHVRLGERVSIHDENHLSTGDDYRVAPVSIGDGAWLGANVVVLSGVRIGAGAVVGAGSVVTSDLPPRTLAVGSPARVVREL